MRGDPAVRGALLLLWLATVNPGLPALADGSEVAVPRPRPAVAMPKPRPRPLRNAKNVAAATPSGCADLRGLGVTFKMRPSIAERGGCQVTTPISVTHFGRPRPVTLTQQALVNCALARQVALWLDQDVQPAAAAILGAPVTRLHVAATYVCRTRNSQAKSKVSEHGYGNAIDLAAFLLADGRRVSVKEHWGNGGREDRFLRRVHRHACTRFTTVIGPDGDRWHQDHFHLDLGRHGRRGTYRVCQ